MPAQLVSKVEPSLIEYYLEEVRRERETRFCTLRVHVPKDLDVLAHEARPVLNRQVSVTKYAAQTGIRAQLDSEGQARTSRDAATIDTTVGLVSPAFF